MMRPTSVPNVVALPKAAMIDAAHLRIALGASRALICLWRRQAAFPASYREGLRTWTLTDDVRRWCENHGSRVVRL